MKKRLRKKLQIKEFRIIEWHVGFKFKYSLKDEAMDEFWDGICNFVDNHKFLYFGGGTCEYQGNFVFFGEPLHQITQELSDEIFNWFNENKYVEIIEINNITNWTDDKLTSLLQKYEVLNDEKK